MKKNIRKFNKIFFLAFLFNSISCLGSLVKQEDEGNPFYQADTRLKASGLLYDRGIEVPSDVFVHNSEWIKNSELTDFFMVYGGKKATKCFASPSLWYPIRNVAVLKRLFSSRLKAPKDILIGFKDLGRDKLRYSEEEEKEYYDLVRLCLKNGADINAQDEDGNTLLHLVSKPIFWTVLFCSNPDFLIKNNLGRSCFEVWKEKQYENSFLAGVLQSAVLQKSSQDPVSESRHSASFAAQCLLDLGADITSVSASDMVTLQSLKVSRDAKIKQIVTIFDALKDVDASTIDHDAQCLRQAYLEFQKGNHAPLQEMLIITSWILSKATGLDQMAVDREVIACQCILKKESIVPLIRYLALDPKFDLKTRCSYKKLIKKYKIALGIPKEPEKLNNEPSASCCSVQ